MEKWWLLALKFCYHVCVYYTFALSIFVNIYQAYFHKTQSRAHSTRLKPKFSPISYVQLEYENSALNWKSSIVTVSKCSFCENTPSQKWQHFLQEILLGKNCAPRLMKFAPSASFLHFFRIIVFYCQIYFNKVKCDRFELKLLKFCLVFSMKKVWYWSVFHKSSSTECVHLSTQCFFNWHSKFNGNVFSG